MTIKSSLILVNVSNKKFRFTRFKYSPIMFKTFGIPPHLAMIALESLSSLESVNSWPLTYIKSINEVKGVSRSQSTEI